MPKVSIIVPIYNVEKYLHRCLDSLLNQTLKDIEIILVDDGSPDNCPAMCDEYAKQDNRIKVIHKKNGGLGLARNSGLEISTGKYVAFLDSDDFVDIKLYKTLVDYAEKNNLDTCYCRTQKYYPSGETRLISELDENKIFDGRSEVDTFLMEMIGGEEHDYGKMKYSIAVWKAIYSMELIRNNNISFVSEREMASEDLFFHIDYLSQANKVGWINDKLHFYFANSNSITTTYLPENYNRNKSAMKNLPERLSIYYPYELFKKYCNGRLITFQKNIIKAEVARKGVSYSEIRNVLKKECDEPMLYFIKTDYSTKRLSFPKKIYIFAFKHKLVDILFFLIQMKSRKKI